MNRKILWGSGAIILLAILLFIGHNRIGSRKYLDLNLMTFNVHNAIGMDGVTDYVRVSNLINKIQPQFVAIQEVDSVTRRSKQIDVMKEFSVNTGMNAVFGRAITFNGGSYGVGLLSKEKPVDVKRISLPGREEKRVLLIAEFENFVFACTHLSLNEEDRMASVKMICDEACRYDKPFVLAGDWNAKPDDRVVKNLQQHFEIINSDFHPTYPSVLPEECIDYIALFKNDKVKLQNVSCEVVLDSLASDHRPVAARIRLEQN